MNTNEIIALQKEITMSEKNDPVSIAALHELSTDETKVWFCRYYAEY